MLSFASATASSTVWNFITGITGQDGAYLAELLLEKGYTVYGTYRRTSSVNFWRIEELDIQQNPNLHLVEYDLTDQGSAIRLLDTTGVTEVYNLAAQSFVGVSFDQPTTTAQITGIGAVNLLAADSYGVPSLMTIARLRAARNGYPWRAGGHGATAFRWLPRSGAYFPVRACRPTALPRKTAI